MEKNQTARSWLRANGYDDVVDMIDEIMIEWKISGKKTRRSWWEVLAGGKHGQPCVVEGREFPVLKAAQKRQGKKTTKNAIFHKKRESAPRIQLQLRWANKVDEDK